MALEIERKFLVNLDHWQAGSKGTPYMQAYIYSSPDKVVRVRMEGDIGKLTIKATVSDLTRKEFEYRIPKEDAMALIEEVCDENRVIKQRYHVIHKGKLWEVDFFEGRNKGLVVAEIELESEDEAFEPPAWLGKEVSADNRYYNAALAIHPYTEWDA